MTASRGKRILFVHHGSTHGGAPLSLLYLLQQLSATGFECVVCSSDADPEVSRIFASCGFQTCYCRMRGFAHTTGGEFNLLSIAGWRASMGWMLDFDKARARLEHTLSEIRPDIVHLNSLVLAPYASVPHQRGIPCVLHLRESILHGTFGYRNRWLSSCLNKNADHVIAICRDNLSRLALRAGKGSVIYNPVEFGKFDFHIDQQAVRRRLGIPGETLVVLFAGGSVPEIKGLREYLRAMALVKRKEPGLVCLLPSFAPPADPAKRAWTWKRRFGWMLGIYRKTDQLHDLIVDGDLQSTLKISPFVYDIENWIAAADVVCVPHTQPHFSRTVMEAGAMKKPVVAYRIGGIEEVVQDGRTGILLPVGEIDGMAEAVLSLFRDGARCRELGENGYQQARALCDAGECAKRVAAIYRRLLEDRRR
jgi:glycosyltransferase involved in cell wall biosynthesis